MGLPGKANLASFTAGFSAGCAGKTNVELVIHRLSHLFKFNGVNAHAALFSNWDVYVHTHAIGGPMQQLARERMELVWAGWHTCLRQQPELADTECPQYIGLYMDAHIALVNCSADSTLSQVYRQRLAPEQSQLSLAASKELVAAVSSVWHLTKTKSHINDLFLKGKPGVLSVRYIRPQLQRCRSAIASQAIASEMLQAWMLGRHSTRQKIAGPAKRVAVCAMTYEQLLARVSCLTSRQLYYIIAECIAVVTISHAHLHVMACGICSEFQAYFDDATTPYHRKKRGVVSTYASGCTASSVKIEQWPLCISRQRPNTGLPEACVHACDACGAVHIKTVRQPRAAKSKSGVSIDLRDPYKAICNQCLSPTRIIQISNYLTKGIVNGKSTVVCLCAMCSTICTHPQTIGHKLYCAACAQLHMQSSQSLAMPCPCGQYVSPVLQNNCISLPSAGTYATVKLCAAHVPMAYELSKLRSLDELCTVIRCIAL